MALLKFVQCTKTRSNLMNNWIFNYRFNEKDIDNEKVEYTVKNIGASERLCPDISGRFGIEMLYEPDGKQHTISCRIKKYHASSRDEIEPGERLKLKSFYRENTKLSIVWKETQGIILMERETQMSMIMIMTIWKMGVHLDKDTTLIPHWLLLNRYSWRARWQEKTVCAPLATAGKQTEFSPFDSLQIIKVPLPFKTRYTCLNASLISGQKYIVSNAVIISNFYMRKSPFSHRWMSGIHHINHNFAANPFGLTSILKKRHTQCSLHS